MTELEDRATFQRYTANERTNHWIVAIAFVLAALSGLPAAHSRTAWVGISLPT